MFCNSKNDYNRALFSRTLSAGVIVCFTLFILFSPIVFASEPACEESDFEGFWVGSTSADEIPVDLTINLSQDNGTVRYKFHYGPPRYCNLICEKIKQEHCLLKLTIKETSGRYCDNLWNGFITLTLQDNTDMDVRVENKGGELKDQANLLKQK